MKNGTPFWWERAGTELGFLALALSTADPRPAREQFDETFGWTPRDVHFDPKNRALFPPPGQPVMYPIAGTSLREEMIYAYEGSWVVVAQPDGSYEAARLD